MKNKPTQKTEPGLTLADVLLLTAAAAADQVAAESKIITRAFVRRGKLIYHLDTMKLRKDQTVYGLLKSRGVSEGSIHSARTVANLIAAMVIPGLVPEDKFDDIITFRNARIGDLLLKGKGKNGYRMEAESLAAVFLSGDSNAVGNELKCLHEHCQTIAEREASIQLAEKEAKAKEAAAEAARKELEERRAADEIAAAEKAKAAAEANQNADDDDEEEADPNEEEEESDEADEEEEESDEDEADPEEEEESDDADEEEEESDEDEADPDEEEEEEEEDEVPQGNTVPFKPADTKPPVTLAGVIGDFNTVLTAALDLDADNMVKLVAYLKGSVADLEATIPAMEKVG